MKKKTRKKKKRDEEVLDALFNETIRYSIVNNYVSAITEFYAWQSEGKTMSLLRKTKLSTVLKSVRRNKDRVRRVNFINRFCPLSPVDTMLKCLKRRLLYFGRR